MTFRRLFPNTNPAKSWQIARQRALQLYREWLREIPRSIVKYPLEISKSEGRARVRAEFEKYRYLSDLPVTNVLLLKGTQDLIELHNKWKQKTHVMRLFEGEWENITKYADNPLKQPPRAQSLPKTSPFLSRFLASRQQQG